jgi:hypothetical protein
MPPEHSQLLMHWPSDQEQVPVAAALLLPLLLLLLLLLLRLPLLLHAAVEQAPLHDERF